MAVKFVVNFCAVCGLILLSSSSITGVELTSEMVKQWADRIGISGSNYIDRITGANDAKRAYENASFSTDLKDLDWREVLKQMKKDMEIFFSRKTRSLKKLVDRAEDEFCKYKYSKNLKISDIDYPNAKNLDQYLNKTGVRLAYDSSFQTEISFNRSVVHVPTDVFDGAAEIVNGINWTSVLDEIFNANRHDDPTLSWQYFGSDKGFMRTYPARRWDSSPSQVDLFDARQRPWYIQGATSPKNVIILIDASGSMHGVPMRIAKLAAQSLIDSFGDNDFFNVVHFNVTAAVLCCQETGPTLLQATKKNKIYVKNKLQQIEDGDVAVWKKGMDKAFELLRKADNCSHCQQAIMVLSDGTTSSLSDFFEENNPDKRVRVFTFAVGPPAESTQALQSMACKNRGYFSRLQSVGAVREVSEDYIRVLTRPMAMAPKANTTDHAVWTTVYRDALGLGMIITATLPVFHRMQGSSNCSSKDGMKDEERTKDHFLGVMGTDVPLHYLQNLILHPLVGPGGYMFAIDNNGMVMFHPRLKTVIMFAAQPNNFINALLETNIRKLVDTAKKYEEVYGYLQDAPGVDLVDVESTESTQNDSKIEELRKAMIDTIRVTEQPYGRGPGSKTFEVYELSVDELRVKKQTMNYYYDGLEGTPFSIAVATPQLGYNYTTGMTLEKVINDLRNQLLKEDKQNIAVERWPYCNNTVMSDSSPLDQLIEETKARDKSLCTNSDLLNGLLGDVTATSNISKLRNFPKSVDAIGIKQIFLRSFWGLTRSVSRDKSSTASQGDYFGRVFGSQIPSDSVVYTSPYRSAKSDKNTTSVFAYKRVFNRHRPAAVLGYESEMDFFVDNILVNNTECDNSSSRECDISCDRTGKNEYEGVYCYLLDENGFVVAGNDKSSAGRFFGRVDAPVMEKLIRSDESSGPGVYNKVVLTDFQGVCEEKNGVNSRGTSFLLKPLFSLSAYTEWWTSKAVWSLLYFNLYSWIFAGSGEATEASEDVPKNVSCIKNVTTYYSTQENISESGTTTCDGCARSHFIANVRKSNLYLVVVNGTCGKCSQSVERMGIPGEPTRIDRKDVSDACKEPAYRKRPKRCFVSTNPETGYTCGVGSLTGPSLRQVIAVQFWVILLTWTASDFL